jgi:hypothetical protein
MNEKKEVGIHCLKVLLSSGIPSARAEGTGSNCLFDGKLTFFRQHGCLVLHQLLDFLTV